MNVDQETLVFRWKGFPPFLSLLMPTFAFLYTPPFLADLASLRIECSPTKYYYFQRFGINLDARLL